MEQSKDFFVKKKHFEAATLTDLEATLLDSSRAGNQTRVTVLQPTIDL